MKTVFHPEHILLDTTSTTQAEVFAFIAAKAHERGYVEDADAFAAGLQARELHGSTGLMGGMAIPHCKHGTVKHAGAFVVRFSHPIEWETMDEQPVTTVISLTIPESGDTDNLRMLGALSRCMMRKPFRDTLQIGNADDVQNAIASAIA